MTLQFINLAATTFNTVLVDLGIGWDWALAILTMASILCGAIILFATVFCLMVLWVSLCFRLMFYAVAAMWDGVKPQLWAMVRGV